MDCKKNNAAKDAEKVKMFPTRQYMEKAFLNLVNLKYQNAKT